MDQATARPQRRQRANRRLHADREKCTLLIDADTSRKLSVAASLRGMDRSELVNEVLAESLRWIVISVRGQNQGSASPAGPVESAGCNAA